MPLVDLDTIVARIRADFPEMPLPVVCSAYPGNTDVHRFFTGKKWSAVTAMRVKQENSGDPCDNGDVSGYVFEMTDEALRYFIPSYMLMALTEYCDYPRNSDTVWIYEPIYAVLTLPSVWSPISFEKDGEEDQAFRKRFEPYTSEQKRDVADFLYHQSFHNGPTFILTNDLSERPWRAYASYWQPFGS